MEAAMVETKPTEKQARSLAFLGLIEDFSLADIATILEAPLSTIQKHDNARKRLMGKLGTKIHAAALTALTKVAKGSNHRIAANVHTDYKMVSDLVAMEWALEELRKRAEEATAIKLSRVTCDAVSHYLLKEAEDAGIARTHVAYQRAVVKISGALEALVIELPHEATSILDDALEELTEAIIDLEEVAHL